MRRGIHIAIGMGAFLLKFLPTWGAVLVAVGGIFFNKYALPRLVPGVVRSGKGGARGLVAYPVTVLLLVLFFPPYIAAAGWAALAFGDGFAGIGHGRGWLGSLPWNPRKSWAGFILCAIFGGYGATALAYWTNSEADLPWIVLPLIAGLAVAFAESAPVVLDDNVRAGLAGGVAVWLLSLSGDPVGLPMAQVAAGLVVASAFGAAAWRMKTITGSGAVAGSLLGGTIWAFGSWKAFCLLAVFFVLGSTATKLGYLAKKRAGLAQEKKGARSVRHVLANGLVPGICAVLMWSTNSPDAWLNLDPHVAALALAGSLAAATADTLGSEIGQLFRGRVWIFGTLRSGSLGSQGGVSWPGSLATVVGASLIGLSAAGLGLFGDTEANPFELPAWVAAAGVVGAYLDSFLGAYLEDRGFMGNEEVNFACTLSGALFFPVLLVLG